MADEAKTQPARRGRPGRPPKVQTETPEGELTPPEGQDSTENGSKAKGKAPALYHVYSTEDEGHNLAWVCDQTAKTAEHAVSLAVKADEALVGKTLTAIPQRNMKTFSTEVRTTTRVKVSVT